LALNVAAAAGASAGSSALISPVGASDDVAGADSSAGEEVRICAQLKQMPGLEQARTVTCQLRGQRFRRDASCNGLSL